MVLPTHTITIYNEVMDEEICGVDDETGLPLKCNVEVGTYKGDLQPMNTNEVVKMFGAMRQGTYKLFLPAGTPIDEQCKISVEGYDGLFQVEGEPHFRNAFIPHIRVILARER